MVGSLAFALSRRALLGTAGALSVALLAWLLYPDSDKEKIRAKLDTLARSLGSGENENMAFRALRLKPVFEETFEQNVHFSAPELSTTSGLRELTQLAASAPRLYGELDVSIGDTDIAVDAATQQATADSEVTLTGTSGEVRRDTRQVRFTLRQSQGEWRIQSIEVAERKQD